MQIRHLIADMATSDTEPFNMTTRIII